MLYIRADGNQIIGSGHIMRCLSIAKALRTIGEDSIFITADNYPEGLIRKHGFTNICLDSDWANLEKESLQLDNLILTGNIKKLLIDSYYITPKYVDNIHNKTKIAYLDDLENFSYAVDLLINYSISAEEDKYKHKYPFTKFLLGTDFIPLREQFQGIRHIYRNKVKDILITTGGSDSFNVTGKLIQGLRANSQFNEINLHIIIGAFNVHKEEILKLSNIHKNICIYQNIDDMAALMSRCDMAISAGGTTLYELCACTVPIVAFTFADNQINGTKALGRHGLLYYAGDIRINLDSCILGIIQKVQEMAQNSYERKYMMEKMRCKVDGYGAKRIANEILIF